MSTPMNVNHDFVVLSVSPKALAKLGSTSWVPALSWEGQTERLIHCVLQTEGPGGLPVEQIFTETISISPSSRVCLFCSNSGNCFLIKRAVRPQKNR